VAGCCECGDEFSGSCATELVKVKYSKSRYNKNIVISSQVLFHNGSLLHSQVQYTTVDYN
jgi:hypothetical protein